MSFSFLRVLPALALAATAGVMHATNVNLITNGSFESPSVGGGYGIFASIPGWTTNGSGIELDYTPIVGGGSAAYQGTQSLEVNAYAPESVSQTISGLTVGHRYILSYAYGDRPNSGGEEKMDTYFGGTLLTTDVSPLTSSPLTWAVNTFVVTATSTSETLTFEGLADSGYASYGNEVDGVSLTAQTPEPSSFYLAVSGLAMVMFAGYRMRRFNS